MDRPIDPRSRAFHRLLYALIAFGIVGGIAWMISIQAQTLDGTIEPAEMQKTLGQDPYHSIVIDTRAIGECQAGHVPFATCVPLDQLGRRVGEFGGAKDRQFILIDEDVAREQKAVQMMVQAGYKTVVLAKGGYAAWRADNRPLSTAPDGAGPHKLVE